MLKTNKNDIKSPAKVLARISYSLMLTVLVILAIVFFTKNNAEFSKKNINQDNEKLTITNDKEIQIDVAINYGVKGNMIIPNGWEVSYYDNFDKKGEGEHPTKYIDIHKNGYVISIKTYGSGRAMCNYIPEKYVHFKDRDGYEYYREKIGDNYTGQLEICSNGVEGKHSTNFGTGETQYGDIEYKIPTSPNEKMVEQMDKIVSSFKSI